MDDEEMAWLAEAAAQLGPAADELSDADALAAAIDALAGVEELAGEEELNEILSAIDENPFSAVASSSANPTETTPSITLSRGITCYNTSCTVFEATKTCSRCKVARYCSADCQKTDWKSHKKNCKKPAINGQQGERGSTKGQQGERNGESGNGESGNGESGNGKSGNGESGNGESGNGESGNGESGNGERGNGESGNGKSGRTSGIKIPDGGAGQHTEWVSEEAADGEEGVDNGRIQELIKKFVLEMGPPLSQEELLASRGREGVQTVELDDIDGIDLQGYKDGPTRGKATQKKSNATEQFDLGKYSCPGCPNKANGFHTCNDRCFEKYGGAQDVTNAESRGQYKSKIKGEGESKSTGESKNTLLLNKLRVDVAVAEEAAVVVEEGWGGEALKGGVKGGVKEAEGEKQDAADCWNKRTDEHGKQFFYNSKMKTSQWQVVEGLLGEAVRANQEGRARDALQYASKANKLDPSNCGAWIEQGRALCRTGELGEANVAAAFCCFEKALQCDFPSTNSPQENAELKLDLQERVEALEPIASQDAIEVARAFIMARVGAA
jgi:hypothetical protein